MKVSVFHTPELVPADSLPNCAIAVDVLRATTTIATALSSGAEAIQVFADLDELLQTSSRHPEHLRLRAAERGGGKVEGFELGNSPFDYTTDLVGGKRIFMSTTNGTRSLQKVQHADVVIACAMINLNAVVRYLHETKPETVWIVGSGWEGSYALEDTACAGGIIAGIETECDLGNDEAVAALTLFKTWQDNLEELFYQASHGRRLLRLNCVEDIVYCAKVGIVDVLPKQSSPGVLVAA